MTEVKEKAGVERTGRPHAKGDGLRLQPDSTNAFGPPSSPPLRIPPEIKRVGRLRCATCGERWPAYENADESLPTACPSCRLIAVHGDEPVDEKWWAWVTDLGEDAVTEMILRETGRLLPPPEPHIPTPTSESPPAPEATHDYLQTL